MKKIYLSLITIALFASNVQSQNILTENFDDVNAMLTTGGWSERNNSVPIGAEIWHNGIGLSIPAYNGDDTSYAEVSFQSTDPQGNISNWLISPTVTLNNGDVVSFYTSSYNNLNFPDRLELRLNTLNTTDVGTTDTSVGDFSTLLLSVNPNLAADSTLYPQLYWGQFSATISGLPGATDCRIAFRYNVLDGGLNGANSSTIGIDALSIDFSVGIAKPSNALSLSVYPNPVTDKLSIEFESPLAENGVMSIYNTLGQTVNTLNVQKGQTKVTFNAAALASGSYTFVLNVPGSVTKKNFVKN